MNVLSPRQYGSYVHKYCADTLTRPETGVHGPCLFGGTPWGTKLPLPTRLGNTPEREVGVLATDGNGVETPSLHAKQLLPGVVVHCPWANTRRLVGWVFRAAQVCSSASWRLSRAGGWHSDMEASVTQSAFLYLSLKRPMSYLHSGLPISAFFECNITAGACSTGLQIVLPRALQPYKLLRSILTESGIPNLTWSVQLCPSERESRSRSNS
eukprot:scaffold7488_cov444-Prasinococcus_capsulatus_cf.AAC.4